MPLLTATPCIFVGRPRLNFSVPSFAQFVRRFSFNAVRV
jgi:hypothetical protein